MTMAWLYGMMFGVVGVICTALLAVFGGAGGMFLGALITLMLTFWGVQEVAERVVEERIEEVRVEAETVDGTVTSND